MLVISRKKGQQVNIGDDVTIRVTRISGSQVRLAIEAPRDQKILRSEIVAGVLDAADMITGERNDH